MSWSIYPQIENVTPAEAVEALKAQSSIPKTILKYLLSGVRAIEKSRGKDARIVVKGSGHLHDGSPGNYDATSADVVVQYIPE